MIDDKFLEDLGLGQIPDSEKDLMIVDIQETLADRIGAKVEKTIGVAKSDEFSKLLEGSDRGALTSWLQANLPNYQQIIQEEIEKIRAEILPQVPDIQAEFAKSA